MLLFGKGNTFNDRLRHFLTERRMKNKDLAEHLGVSVTTVGYWLSGKREPSEKHIDEICVLFGVNYLEFMYTSEQLAVGNLRFLFKKYNLDMDDFERFKELEDFIGICFIDNIGKYRRKK